MKQTAARTNGKDKAVALKIIPEQTEVATENDANVGALESINAMIAELNAQNLGLRNRTVQLAGQLAHKDAIIAKRDATIQDLLAIKKAK